VTATYFNSEAEARTVVADIIRPVYGAAHLFIAERNKMNIGLREVVFVARVTKDDSKGNNLVNAFFEAQLSQDERLEWMGTKMDFMQDEETEYFLIKTVIENGN